jgi:hypothetical protein
VNSGLLDDNSDYDNNEGEFFHHSNKDHLIMRFHLLGTRSVTSIKLVWRSLQWFISNDIYAIREMNSLHKLPRGFTFLHTGVRVYQGSV